MTVVLDNLAAVRRTAMDLLARREHGRVELTRKLRQRGACPDMIDIALDRLTEDGLLSESRYLESYISYRAGSGYGPLRIREELNQRGLPRHDVEDALRECGFNWQERLEETGRCERACTPRALLELSRVSAGNDRPLVKWPRI